MLLTTCALCREEPTAHFEYWSRARGQELRISPHLARDFPMYVGADRKDNGNKNMILKGQQNRSRGKSKEYTFPSLQMWNTGRGEGA